MVDILVSVLRQLHIPNLAKSKKEVAAKFTVVLNSCKYFT